MTAHISEALRSALEKGEAEQLAAVLLALATGRKRGTTVQIAALREIGAPDKDAKGHDWVIARMHGLGDYLDLTQLPRERPDFPP